MSLRVTNIAIPAGVDAYQEIQVEGDTIFCYDATTQFYVSLDNGAPFPMERGMKYTVGTRLIRLINRTAAIVSGVMLVGMGQEVEDYRPTSKPASPSNGVMLFNGIVGNNGNPLTAPLCEVGNPQRVDLTLYPSSTNTGDIYLISAQASAKIIGVARPGVVTTIKYSGPVYVYAGNNTDQALVFATYF